MVDRRKRRTHRSRNRSRGGTVGDRPVSAARPPWVPEFSFANCGLTHVLARLPVVARHGAGAFTAIAVVALGGLTWQQTGVYRDGITLFGHIIAHNPTARTAHFNLAISLFAAGRIEESLAAIQVAREQRPDAPGPHGILGRILVVDGRFEEAEQALQRALELDPRHRGALQGRAELARRRGNFAQAETRYREVLVVDGEYGLAHAGLGVVLFEQKRYAEALDHLRIAVEWPTTVDSRDVLYLLMGRSAKELGYLDESEEYLARVPAAITAEEQRPETPKPSLVLAQAFIDQGRFEDAEAALQEVVEVDPEHPGAMQMWAEVAQRRGRLAEAEARYRKVLETDEGHGLAHAGLGTVLFRQRRNAEALDHLRLAVESPATADTRGMLYLLMGQAAGELGHLEEADAHLESAIAAMPDNVLTFLAMADLRTRQGREDEADAYRHRARAIRPHDPNLLRMIAESLRNEGRIDEAITVYEEALEIDARNALVHAGLGIALYQRGRFRAAVDSMTRALELRPDLPYAVSLRLFSGHSLRELGDIPAASGQYELAVEIEPGNREALNHLAMSLFELKRYEEAHERYLELVELDPDGAVAHSNRGLVLHRLGRNEEAIASIQRALELDPALEQAHTALAEARSALGLIDR